jgi:hypothetical protein
MNEMHEYESAIERTDRLWRQPNFCLTLSADEARYLARALEADPTRRLSPVRSQLGRLHESTLYLHLEMLEDTRACLHASVYVHGLKARTLAEARLAMTLMAKLSNTPRPR